MKYTLEYIYYLYKKEFQYKELMAQEAKNQIKKHFSKPSKKYYSCRENLERIIKHKNKVVKKFNRSISSHF